MAKEEMTELINTCIKMAKCKESCSLIEGILAVIPYQKLLEQRNNFDDVEYELLIVKKIKALHMRPENYEKFRRSVSYCPAVFELIEYEKGLGITNIADSPLIERVNNALFRQEDSVELVLRSLNSGINRLRKLAELKAIKTMAKDKDSPWDSFIKYYIPEFKEVSFRIDEIINMFEYYRGIRALENPLTVSELASFSETEVPSVRGIAEEKIESLIQDEIQIPMSEFVSLTNCANDKIAYLTRAKCWELTDGDPKEITDLFGGTEEELSSTYFQYYLDTVPVSGDVLDEKGDLGEKLTRRKGDNNDKY